MNWTPVAERLPADGRKVIAYYQNENGKHRRIMAYYASQFALEGSEEDQLEATEYHAEKDQYFLREGWYENNEFDDVNWRVGGEITHWMELPPPPVEVA